MEEDISKSLKSALEDAITEDEAIENNWTFVLTENISLTKNNGVTEMSDNYSEQGSDSGSSIVVIDSPVLPSCDLHPVLGDTVNQQLLKNVEGQSEGFDVSPCFDNISCSSHQSSNNQFLKECSPYEDMEQPDTWDCDHEADQPDGEESKTSNNSLANSRLLVEDIEALVIPTENDVETNTNLEFVQNEKTILKDFLVSENSPLTNDVTCQEEQQSVSEIESGDGFVCDIVLEITQMEETRVNDFADHQQLDNLIACVEKQQILSEHEASGLENDANLEVSRNENVILSDSSKSARDDEIACVGEQQVDVSFNTDLTDSVAYIEDNIISTETPEDTKAAQSIYAPVSERKVDLDEDTESTNHDPTQPDDQSSYSVDDESEDETWDLSLEAVVNANSLASSVSSLVQPPFSPSPMVIPADGYQRSHTMLKPDLLEEANRIEELDLMDYSAVTNSDLPADIVVANIVPDRHYVHRPNQRLNEKLSFVMAFALAAVFGFAIGHLIGLSDNFPSRCSLREEQMKHDGSHSYEGWTEEDWLVEVKRLASYNEELSRTLKELSGQDSTSCRFDFQVNELITENWDLKQSIGRIRYGKPTRSVEDRDTINRLQTENQDLRAIVGKLRYRCGVQPISSPEQQDQAISTPSETFVPRPSAAEPLWNTFGVNLTSNWNRLINYGHNRSIEDKLNAVKESAIDFIRLIGLRQDELNNLTRENNNKVAEKMEARFKKSVKKTADLLERVNKEHESFTSLLEEVENRLDKLRSKLEFHWSNLLQSYSGAGNRFVTSENTKPLNSDWFLSMGQQRDKMRHSEKQSEWMFDRAKNRELERRSRKFQTKQKKQKTFQGNSWNHYSS